MRVKESEVRIEKDSEQEETYLLSTPSVMVLGQRHVSAGPGTGAKPSEPILAIPEEVAVSADTGLVVAQCSYKRW